MALDDPKELLRMFITALDKIRGHDPIEPADRIKMTNDLTEVYNYLSRVSRKPSFINAIHSMSAQDAKLDSRLAKERETLREHQSFVETNFEKADQYLKTIQLGGYAVFFGLWSLTGDMLSPLWVAIAALLMTSSATMFVIWEVCKSTVLAFSLRRQALIGGSKIEDFLRSRVVHLTRDKSAVIILAQARAFAWMFSMIPAICAVGIMLYQLIAYIIVKGVF